MDMIFPGALDALFNWFLIVVFGGIIGWFLGKSMVKTVRSRDGTTKNQEAGFIVLFVAAGLLLGAFLGCEVLATP
jgi:hypothetical protein